MTTMYMTNEEILLRTAKNRVDEFERLQRRGDYWVHREVALAQGKVGEEKPGFLARTLIRAADALVSLGLRLRTRAGTYLPVAVVPMSECTGDAFQEGWCVCAVRQG
jgi:hypothetical protein